MSLQVINFQLIRDLGQSLKGIQSISTTSLHDITVVLVYIRRLYALQNIAGKKSNS